MSAGARVWYCYAVTRQLPPGAFEGLPGLRDSTVDSDAEVDTVDCAGLSAVVSPVPAAEFGEAALRANLENLGWLEEVARRHNDVVAEAARRATTLPFRLATIYLDRQRVHDVLRSGAERIGAALDRVEGRSEWGVKVYAESTARAVEQPVVPSGSADPPGRSYLRKRLAERRSRDAGWARAEATAAEVDRALGALAVDRRAHRPQSTRLSGGGEQNVLNVAYLVGDAGVESFLAKADELRAAAGECRVELTGPWVPYSFALPDLGETEDTAS
ncbi:GvpL/GvpF family gas vesicle protein [Amycolatopsis sp. NPDC059027]|uniref:GvpL/GvpF family gas vesicle protein n=1 Tax=Amycolatopsis sp. NPDC059027 TaxID=3346709 RepID=UPI003672756D